MDGSGLPGRGCSLPVTRKLYHEKDGTASSAWAVVLGLDMSFVTSSSPEDVDEGGEMEDDAEMEGMLVTAVALRPPPVPFKAGGIAPVDGTSAVPVLLLS